MASRVAEVVDELYAAQRERDATLTQRLNELERRRGGGVISPTKASRRNVKKNNARGRGRYFDELPENAAKERRLIPFYYPGVDDDDDDVDDDENYDNFDVTAKQLTLQFRHRVEEVEAEKRRTERIVEAEIKAAVEERDRVLGKCRIMREEMEKMKKKSLEQVDEGVIKT